MRQRLTPNAPGPGRADERPGGGAHLAALSSLTAFVRGDWAAARRYAERTVALRPQLDARSWAYGVLYDAEGRLQLALGQWDAAVDGAQAHLAWAKESSRLGDVRIVQRVLAELDLYRDDPSSARDRLVPLLDRPGMVELEVNPLLPLLIWAHLDLSEIEAAEALAMQTVARLRTHHDHLTLVDALRIEAAVWIRQQRWVEAEAALDEALALARQMPYPYAEAKLLATYGDVRSTWGPGAGTPSVYCRTVDPSATRGSTLRRADPAGSGKLSHHRSCTRLHPVARQEKRTFSQVTVEKSQATVENSEKRHKLFRTLRWNFFFSHVRTELTARYREELLVARYQPDDLLQNWWKAFDFFLGRACYQGRSDEASTKVYETVVGVLKPYVPVSRDFLTDAQLMEAYNTLQATIGPGKVGKARDVDMLVSALHFIRQLPEANIVAYSVRSITAGNIRAHYDELQKAQNHATGIVQVGPMVAAFYLRDVVSLYKLETHVPTDVQIFLQPIDVSVRAFAVEQGLVDAQTASDEVIQHAIVQLCQQYGCSPFQFNQGVWYRTSIGAEL